MRIRLKKGVALFGTIAGAAVATALIVYNVNHGNSLNTSDLENSGLLEELEEAIGVGETKETTHAVIADVDGNGAAAAAGLLGNDFADAPASDEARTEGDISAQDTVSGAGDNSTNSAEDAGYTDSGAVPASAAEAAAPAGQELNTYVEAVPETHTETVVNEQRVVVETPVTVTEQITEEVEADPVDFKAHSSVAVSGEMTQDRRAQEAQAAYKADMERLEAARQEAERAAVEQGYEEKTGDDIEGHDTLGDSFIIFY